MGSNPIVASTPQARNDPLVTSGSSFGREFAADPWIAADQMGRDCPPRSVQSGTELASEGSASRSTRCSGPDKRPDRLMEDPKNPATRSIRDGGLVGSPRVIPGSDFAFDRCGISLLSRRARSAYRRTMRTLPLIGLTFALLASCSIGPGWTTPGAHVVDGYWLGTETQCPLEGGEGLDCGHAVPVAVRTLLTEEPTAVVTAAWAAQAADTWLDAKGDRQGPAWMSTVWSTHVVLDLEDGRRRVFAAQCPVGPPRARLCQHMDVIAYPVGAEPWK
jgi:hypothetical protein